MPDPPRKYQSSWGPEITSGGIDGDGCGVGDGDGAGKGEGVGAGLGAGVGLGFGVGLAAGEGEGDGEGLGKGGSVGGGRICTYGRFSAKQELLYDLNANQAPIADAGPPQSGRVLDVLIFDGTAQGPSQE